MKDIGKKSNIHQGHTPGRCHWFHAVKNEKLHQCVFLIIARWHILSTYTKTKRKVKPAQPMNIVALLSLANLENVSLLFSFLNRHPFFFLVLSCSYHLPTISISNSSHTFQLYMFPSTNFTYCILNFHFSCCHSFV